MAHEIAMPPTPSFVFVFGKNPLLSLAELVQYAKRQKTDWVIQPEWPFAALIQGTVERPERIVSDLGGTVKIVCITENFSSLKTRELLALLQKNKGLSNLPVKFAFGLSTASVENQQAFTFLEHLKTIFKQNRAKAVFKKGSNRKTTAITTPSEITSWKLLANQTDFWLSKSKTQNRFWFGYTVAVSNPKDWKNRDENRPQKDAKEILSIRLAKILLNIGADQNSRTVLDPFCGYGTILQEALLMGWNAIGIEKDESKTFACQKNLDWITRTKKINSTFRVLQGDSTRVHLLVKPGDFDWLVTEPYLGPYLTKRPSPQHAQKILEELKILYEKTFFSLGRVMKTGQRCVVVLPVLVTLNNTKKTVSERVFKTDFRAVNPLSDFGNRFANAFPCLYQNPNNLIQRQIWVLEKR